MQSPQGWASMPPRLASAFADKGGTARSEDFSIAGSVDTAWALMVLQHASWEVMAGMLQGRAIAAGSGVLMQAHGKGRAKQGAVPPARTARVRKRPNPALNFIRVSLRPKRTSRQTSRGLVLDWY
jgi:hypothetical protein